MKTLEEFAIKEIQELRKDIKTVEEAYEVSLKREAELIQERDEWKLKYNELIEKLKEDFKPELCRSTGGEHYIKTNNNWMWESTKDGNYQYYKEIFNLKEDGEDE